MDWLESEIKDYQERFSLTLNAKKNKKEKRLQYSLKLERQALQLMNMIQGIFLSTQETLVQNDIESKHAFEWAEGIEKPYLTKISLEITCSISKNKYRHGYELPLRLTSVIGIFFDIKLPIEGLPSRKACEMESITLPVVEKSMRNFIKAALQSNSNQLGKDREHDEEKRGKKSRER